MSSKNDAFQLTAIRNLVASLRKFAKTWEKEAQSVYTLPENVHHARGMADGYKRAAKFLEDILETTID
jgi:hypothetical protein